MILAPTLADPDPVTAESKQHPPVARRALGRRPVRQSPPPVEQSLDHGLDAVVDLLLNVSTGAYKTRQNTPFAGVLADNLRRQVLCSLSRHRRRRE